jgi:hypothetical protein
VLTGAELHGERLRAADLFARFPVAVLEAG